MQIQFLNKNTLKQFISDNRLNEVVKNLIFQLNEFLDKKKNDIDYEPIRKLSDVLIINSGKLNGLEHDKIIGILDRETQRITFAEVQNAVLYIIDQLPNQFWAYRNTTNELSYKTQLIEGVELLHQQQTQFEYDIFICFSTKDREIAKPVWETLRGYGLNVFVSDEDLQNTVGFNFLNKIDFALGNSQHMVLLASKNSLNSIYVQDEYQSFYSDCHAKDPNNRLLIVYKLGDFQIEELPRILRTKQIANSAEQIIATLVQENLIKHKTTFEKQVYENERKNKDEVVRNETLLQKYKISETEDLLKTKLTDEIKIFVEKFKGEWNHLNWIDFRENISGKFGKTDERKLVEIFENEKRNYQNILKQQQEELEKQRNLENMIKNQIPSLSKQFVEDKQGNWDHLEWLDFRDDIFNQFGFFNERQLGEILENEKQIYIQQVEQIKKQEEERKAKEQAELKRKQKEERKAKEQAELKQKLEQERIAKEQVDLKHKQEDEQIEKEQAELKHNESHKDIVWLNNKFGSFIDTRDQNKYNVVKIGGQIWLAENLRYTNKLEEKKDFFVNKKNIKENCCYYNYYALPNVIPKGWHIPTVEEWFALKTFLGANSASQIKATTNWSSNRNGNNNTGFNAEPFGYSTGDGFLVFENDSALFISQTIYNNKVFVLCLRGNNDDFYITDYHIDNYYNIRCIKDGSASSFTQNIFQ